ncbi:MAG TPA: radical SAM family heme chaperone HemW [Gemmatimonadales bacterium]|nr:radical SAM family heme chaperone HemW [Gemmatimonadales bacterium]
MHLYIHVPFCRRRCSYCDFSIAVRKQIPAREFVDVILREVGQHELTNLETIYFGGGTPSLLPPDAVSEILRRTPRPSLRSGQAHARRTVVEVTLEANPEDVTGETATAWAAAGINRVSLGAQSFHDNVLQWMHRVHDAARIGVAVDALRAAGIDNISLDLIFALPGELQRDWERDLDLALALKPTHLSLYGLTIEPRTPLERWISRGSTEAPDEERYAADYLFAHERLSAAGYEFYEVSNASLPGYRSRHNSAYWSGKPYVGLGPAAHSFDGRTRRWNLRAWEAYRRAIVEGRSAVESEETLTADQQELETIYLGLRTAEGLPLTALDRLRPPLPAQSQGWLVERDGRVQCTPEGWLRLDSLIP